LPRAPAAAPPPPATAAAAGQPGRCTYRVSPIFANAGVTGVVLVIEIGMGTNFATVWQQAIRRLQDCCTTAGLVPDSQEVEAASRCVEPLYGLPQTPKAAWKKMVLQLKVGKPVCR
jgi:hypothetical protein